MLYLKITNVKVYATQAIKNKDHFLEQEFKNYIFSQI